MTEETWQTTIDINLTGVWKTCKATVPHIVAGGRGGSVIITSSAATAMISANIAHYTAAKHGLIGFMRVLAKELAPHRIRVNTLHPTGVRTPMIFNEPMYRLFRPDLDDPGPGGLRGGGALAPCPGSSRPSSPRTSPRPSSTSPRRRAVT